MYNMLPNACKLLTSYLSNRKQCVQYFNKKSTLGDIAAGVPQGSVLGPLLFLLFINDFPDALSPEDTLLYADDTTIFSAGASSDEALLARAGMMDVAKGWFDANRLTLNEAKTEQLTFTLRNTSEYQQSTNFLGVVLDTQLVWHTHCDALRRRLSSAAFALRRLSESVSENVLRVAYYGMFQAHLTYGLLSWGHSAVSDRVFGIQRRVIRFMDGRGYQEDCRSSFVRLRLLTLPSLYIYECLKYLTSHMDEYHHHCAIHGYNTRKNNNIRHNSLRLKRSRNGGNYFGIKFYNCIGSRIRELPRQKFLGYLKAYLVEGAFFSIAEFMENPPKDQNTCH